MNPAVVFQRETSTRFAKLRSDIILFGTIVFSSVAKQKSDILVSFVNRHVCCINIYFKTIEKSHNRNIN